MNRTNKKSEKTPLTSVKKMSSQQLESKLLLLENCCKR